MNLVFDFLNNDIKINKNDTIVIGVSSGPDSMCLLYILMELRKKIGFKIVIAHVNHKKRIESDEEEQFLKLYAEEHNIIFEVLEFKSLKNDNFHKLAREFRYNFYKDLVNKYNASYLMTAHHGDDLTETILMRLVRGSNLKGYHGISLITNMDNYLIVRPLLYITKAEIEEFNKANSIPYRIDQSNFSDKYTRNRYRKNILPFLKKENKNVHLKFLKFSKLMNEVDNYIEKEVNNAYNNIYKDGCIDISSFKELDLFIQKLLIEKILSNIYDDLSVITDKHIELIINLLKRRKSGSILNLPNSLICIIDYDYLRFKTKELYSDYNYLLQDGLVLPNGMKFIKYDGKEKGNDTIHLVSSELNLPLYVRNKHDGDYIELKGMNAKKKVSNIFIDSKISKLERNNYPVVVDSSGKIVWIPKLKKSKYDSQNYEICDIIFKCL